MTGIMRVISHVFTITFLLILAKGICSAAVSHGRVDRVHSLRSDGCIVEKVSLYPQQADDPSDTITREGLLYRYPNAKATILITHGFMCDKDDVGFLRHIFFPRGEYNAMTFDFRAHGKKIDGQHCTFGNDEAYDVAAAAKFLRNHPDLRGKPLFVYGFSMGAAASIEAQARYAGLFDGMILDCPFDSSETVIRKGLENLKFSLFGYEFNMPGKSLLEKYAFQPYVQSFIKAALKTVVYVDTQNIPIRIRPFFPSESIKKVSAPCFFIHCKNDEKVPVDSVRAIFAGAQGYKKLWITNGRRHYDSFFHNPEEYIDQLRGFISMVMNGEARPNGAGIVIEDPDEHDE